MSDVARHLNPPGLMDAGRFFSQVVIAPHGTTVYVAGQTGFRVDRSISPTKEGQMAQAFENVKIALEAAQARMDLVVSMTIYHRRLHRGRPGTAGALHGGPLPAGPPACEHSRAGPPPRPGRVVVRDRCNGGNTGAVKGRFTSRFAAIPP
jgi:hypothetical protein